MYFDVGQDLNWTSWSWGWEWPDELQLAAGDRRSVTDGDDPRKLQRKLLVVAYIITHRRGHNITIESETTKYFYLNEVTNHQ